MAAYEVKYNVCCNQTIQLVMDLSQKGLVLI